MNDLLRLLNHLSAAWIAAGAGETAMPGIRLREVQIEEDGFRIEGSLDHPLGAGEFALRGRIESSGTARKRIHLRLERCPDRLEGILAPFRDVIESARITLEVDFDQASVEVKGSAG